MVIWQKENVFFVFELKKILIFSDETLQKRIKRASARDLRILYQKNLAINFCTPSPPSLVAVNIRSRAWLNNSQNITFKFNTIKTLYLIWNNSIDT